MKRTVMQTTLVIAAIGMLSLGLAGCPKEPEPPPPTPTPEPVSVHTVIIKIGTIIVDEQEVIACVADPDDLKGVDGGDEVVIENTTELNVDVVVPAGVFVGDPGTIQLGPSAISKQVAQEQENETTYDYTVKCVSEEPEYAQSTPKIVIM